MSAADKTLELLSYFTDQRPEIGLSQLCRLAGRDKATTYRHLQTLETAGLVEQNPMTKGYRLGPALLQLARLRERTVPRRAGVTAPLRALAEATGETVHVTVLSGLALYALEQLESVRHSTRVLIDVSVFPLHATASGLCALAFGPEALRPVAVENLTRFTPETLTRPEDLDAEIQRIRARGIAHSSGGYERDVHSLAAPLFDQTGEFAGSVTVACVATRMTPALEATICDSLMTAAREISRNWGGSVPGAIETTWAESRGLQEELDPTP